MLVVSPWSLNEGLTNVMMVIVIGLTQDILQQFQVKYKYQYTGSNNTLHDYMYSSGTRYKVLVLRLRYTLGVLLVLQYRTTVAYWPQSRVQLWNFK
jgi:hypothetical protein